MKYSLMKEVISLVEEFESINQKLYSDDVLGFKKWVHDEMNKETSIVEPLWEGKENGRSPESIINTLLVHLNRYAKTYSKAAIQDSEFSTQEEFVYLILLKAHGAMPKMELIKKNIQDKSSGMQIINRLIQQDWVVQKDSVSDKRSKIITISKKGLEVLAFQMEKIRQATNIVTGNLEYSEKMELIRLLNKLENFHNPIFNKNLPSSNLLDIVSNEYLSSSN